MIPTPDISHLNKKDFDEIYEPAGVCRTIPEPLVANATCCLTEDTFLLLDGLEADAEALKELRATVCLEIG